MKLIVLALIVLNSQISLANTAEVCPEPAGQFIPIEFPKGPSRGRSYINGVAQPQPIVEMEPQYIRVHPSGNYVIASLDNGTAVVIDISDKNLPKLIKTPLKNEAAPLEPSWDLISSPYDKKGMEYYSFKDLISDEEKKEPTPKSKFSDYRHNQYYQSLSEYPDSKPDNRRFRVVLFTTLISRDYEVRPLPDKSKVLVNKGKLEYLCENVNKNFFTPILSKDGKEMGVTLTDDVDSFQSAETVIVKIGQNGSCDITDKIGTGTSKLAFTYPEQGKKGLVAFTSKQNAENGDDKDVVQIYDRDKKTSYNISAPWQETTVGYPGFTQSGDLIYVAKRNGTNGLVYVKKDELKPKTSTFPFPEDAYARCFKKDAKKNQGYESNPAPKTDAAY